MNEVAASSGVTKKKFAAPPVKSACLAWYVSVMSHMYSHIHTHLHTRTSAASLFVIPALTIVGLAVMIILPDYLINGVGAVRLTILMSCEAELPGPDVTVVNRVQLYATSPVPPFSSPSPSPSPLGVQPDLRSQHLTLPILKMTQLNVSPCTVSE